MVHYVTVFEPFLKAITGKIDACRISFATHIRERDENYDVLCTFTVDSKICASFDEREVVDFRDIGVHWHDLLLEPSAELLQYIRSFRLERLVK